MYKGTTPTFTLTFPEDVNFGDTNVYVTISNNSKKELITKSNDDLEIDHNIIQVYLNQSETLSLPNRILLQVNWTYAEDGTTKRACSQIVTVINDDNLKNEVLA